MNHISEIAYKGIEEALGKYETVMLPVLREILGDHIVGIPDPMSAPRGETVIGNITADVSWEKGQQIVSALERIDCRLQELGAVEKFNGMAIDGLKMNWIAFLTKPTQ